METLALELPREDLEAFCRRWKISELAVFGSALRDDFGPDSDIDFLATFAPDARWSLLDIVGAEEELAKIVGRPVDLVERKTVEQSENWIRRKNILETARPIYGR